jgi:hypothetical protein
MQGWAAAPGPQTNANCPAQAPCRSLFGPLALKLNSTRSPPFQTSRTIVANGKFADANPLLIRRIASPFPTHYFTEERKASAARRAVPGTFLPRRFEVVGGYGYQAIRG